MARVWHLLAVLVFCAALDVNASPGDEDLGDIFEKGLDIFKGVFDTNALIRRIANLLLDIILGGNDDDSDESGEDNGNGNDDNGNGNGNNGKIENGVNGNGDKRTENGNGEKGNGLEKNGHETRNNDNRNNGNEKNGNGGREKNENGKNGNGKNGNKNGNEENGNGKNRNAKNENNGKGNGRNGNGRNGNEKNGNGRNGNGRNGNGRNGKSGNGNGGNGNGNGGNGKGRKRRAVSNGNNGGNGNGNNGSNGNSNDGGNEKNNGNGNSNNGGNGNGGNGRENAIDTNGNGNGNGNKKNNEGKNGKDHSGKGEKGNGNGRNGNDKNGNGENGKDRKGGKNGNNENGNGKNGNGKNENGKNGNGDNGGNGENGEREGGESGESGESGERLSARDMIRLVDLLTRTVKDNCVGRVASGHRAIGCVANMDCCQYGLAIDAFCEGEAVCCYTKDLCGDKPVDPIDTPAVPVPAPTTTASPEVGCSATSRDGRRGQCVKVGCCKDSFQVTSASLCTTGMTCCYSGLKPSCYGGCGDIEYVSRSEWDAESGKGLSSMRVPVNKVFMHHTAGSECNSKSSCIAEVRSVQKYHIYNKDYSDIAYNFLIGGDGRVYVGRDWNKIGAHTYGYNRVSVAFAMIGNYMNKLPSDVQLNTARKLLACGINSGKISENYGLYGHLDVNPTDCPGDTYYNHLKSWDRWHKFGKLRFYVPPPGS